MKSTVRPDVIRLLIDAYEEVRPRLLENQPGFPAASALRDVVDARVGTPVTLDAAGTRDPDGNALRYGWFFFPEAGTGIPGRPVFAGSPRARRGPPPGAGGIPSAPEGGPPMPTPRVTLRDDTTARATVVPNVAGTAHVILAVEDDGVPSLTSSRRIIFDIQPAAPSAPKP